MEPSFERRSAVDRRPLGLHHARHLQGDCEPRARRDVPATAPQRGRAAPCVGRASQTVIPSAVLHL
ncbi:hypothetical protein M885DRAFT_525263 [Pelagophyceae sp. CCMP2097]|nr:hypothetical protein M885DRAFT_525263 [Pelagophyceae sp. CCMP2097]